MFGVIAAHYVDEPAGGGAYFDEVAFFGTALSSARIAAHHAAA